MMRNLQILGLTLVAALAIGALSASMASADEFTSESQPVTLTGKSEGSDVLTITAGNTTCKESKYKGTSITPTTTVSVAPEYPLKTADGQQNCTSLGFPAEIDVNGCTYLFHIGSVTAGTVDIVCPAGKEITITANLIPNKCIIHIPPQTGLGTATYSNVGTGTTRELRVEAKLTNIKYSHTRPLGEVGLGACTAGVGTTGSYTGKAIVTGEKDNGTEHVGIFLS